MHTPVHARYSRFILIPLTVVLFCFSCDLRGGREQPGVIVRSRSDSTGIPQPVFAIGAGGHSISEIAENSVNSVVNISSVRVSRSQGGLPFDDPLLRRFFGPELQQRPRRTQGLGSGVIITDNGVVVTSSHVVEDASQILVTVPDGRQYKVDTVVADPMSDIAVLRLKGDVKGLRPLPIGDSRKLRLGEVVLAIGNPFGLSNTVTMGIVSALGRANVGIVNYEDFIQTDAAINPGNSGGALVNMNGELIGINSAIATESGGNQGIGFAIPSKMFGVVVESLLKSGKVVRGWMGVEILPVTPAIAASMKLPSIRGAIVENVESNSPAEKAGIKRYDVIVGLNGQPVASAPDLRNAIALMGPGKRVELRILRDGREKTVVLTLGELPARRASQRARPPSNIQPESLGSDLDDIDSLTRARFNIPRKIGRGAVVSGVEEGGPADRAGMLPGDVILEVNRKPVTSAEMFHKQYRNARDPLLLLVYRSGKIVLFTLPK